MKVVELFAGTRSIGKAFEKRGHEVFSVEWDKDFENLNLYADIGKITAVEILEKFGNPDVIWASSEYAKFCDDVDKIVLKLIRELNPKYWFIENPRGGCERSHG